ncbi:MAG: hypothetical protein IJ677_08075 [Alphaproteobacteria bacterium]|nr:hypothetical protein [Alphaproteobacteria bacterium]
MDFKEVIPITALRKFNAMCLHSPKLHQDRELQQQILNWAADMLLEAREYWSKLHATTIDAVITEDRKTQAKKRGKARDNEYAPFREYYKQIQKEEFDKASKEGRKLTANSFAHWYFKNKANDVPIPYAEANKLHKLIRLAEANNREFKNHP